MTVTVNDKKEVLVDGVVKAVLVPPTMRLGEQYRVQTPSGEKMGVVRRPFTRQNWKTEHGSHASYATLERALEVVLEKYERLLAWRRKRDADEEG